MTRKASHTPSSRPRSGAESGGERIGWKGAKMPRLNPTFPSPRLLNSSCLRCRRCRPARTPRPLGEASGMSLGANGLVAHRWVSPSPRYKR